MRLPEYREANSQISTQKEDNVKKVALTLFVPLLAAAVAMTTLMGVSFAQSADADTASSAPSGLTATLTDSGVALAWTQGTDPAATFQRIEVHAVGVNPPWTTGAWLPSTSNAWVFQISPVVDPWALTAGRSYTVQVLAMGVVNGDAVVVNRSNAVTVAIPAVQSEPVAQQASPDPPATQEPAPPATAEPAAPASPPAQRNPSALSASVSNGIVTLTWTPGTDSRIVRQVVKRREPRKGWTNVEVSVSANSYTDATAQSGKRYIYRIQGQRSNGRGGISNVARVAVR